MSSRNLFLSDIESLLPDIVRCPAFISRPEYSTRPDMLPQEVFAKRLRGRKKVPVESLTILLPVTYIGACHVAGGG